MAAVTWCRASRGSRGTVLNKSASFTGTAQDVVAAVASYRIVPESIIATVDTDDALLTLFAGTDEAGNRMIYQKFADNSGVIQESFDGIALPTNTALKVTVSAGNTYIVLWYHLEPAPV